MEPLQATQSKLDRKPIIPPALAEKLVEHLLLIERKYVGCTPDDIRSIAFQLPYQNKIPSPFSVAKEAAGKDSFKHFMKRYSDKLSFRQPTGISIARDTDSARKKWVFSLICMPGSANRKNFDNWL